MNDNFHQNFHQQLDEKLVLMRGFRADPNRPEKSISDHYRHFRQEQTS